MSSKKQIGQGRRNRRTNNTGLLDSAGRAVAVAVSAALSGMLAQSAEAKGGIKVEKVARGTARFDSRGPNTQITVSDRAIINYRKFDVARNEGVQFVQPSPKSRVLNRINSAEPSRIDGRMSANGIVYFVNPSGVMFGRDAVINVGKLYAAAANISDGDFVGGINRFVGGLGAVVNEGTIHADAVTLVGRRVINQGEILSTSAVTMVAGEDVLVGERDGNLFVKVDTVRGLSDSTGNTATAKGSAVRMGAGDMFSVAVYNEGRVKAKQITAQSGPGGATIVSGTLDASSGKAGETGGTVKVLGDKVALAGATIDASGPAGGGTVLVGGDFQGKGDVPTASRTVVTAGSNIKADATDNGAGGKVVVWADGATTFAGNITARGGAAGGDGGNVEVSGKQTLNFTGGVDTAAPAGKTGSLLLDPDTIEIVAGAAGTGADDTHIDINGLLDEVTAASASVISAGTLEALGLGAHVSLTATTEIKSVLPTLDLKQEGTGSVAMSADQIHLGLTTISTHGAPVTLTATTDLNVGGITTNAGSAVTGGAVNLTLTGVGTLKSGPITTAGATAGGKVTVTAPLSTEAKAIDLGVINAGTGDVTVAATSGGVTLQQITGKAVDISASADILGAGTITGASVKLVSSNGSVGDSATPAPILVDSTAGVIAEAKKDVVIADPALTMTLDHVTAGGSAVITAAGDLLTTPTSTVTAGVKATVTSSTGKIGTDAASPLVVDASAATLDAKTDLHVKLVQLATGGIVASAGDAATAGLYTVGVTDGAARDYKLTYAKASDLTIIVPGSLANDTTTPPTPPPAVIAAKVLTLDAASLGASSSPLLTDAIELKAVTTAGGIFVKEANGLVTQKVDATGGKVSIDVVKGDLKITDQISGTDVSLAAGRDILYAASGKRVLGSNVSLDAGTDTTLPSTDNAKIGTAGSPVKTAASTLKLTSHLGTSQTDASVNASDTDGVTLTATAGGKVNVTTEGAGDLFVNNVTGGSVALHANAGSVLALNSSSTVTTTGAVLATEKLVDIVASKDVGQLDDPANPTAGGLMNIDALGGLVSISGESVYLSNVATGQPGNIELTAATPPATVGFDRDTVQAYALTVTNDLTVETNGWIRDTAGQQLSLGKTVDLRSRTAGIGQAGKPILTAAKAIRATAKGAGGVFITDNGLGTVDVKDVTTQGGPIQLISSAGSLNLTGRVDAGTSPTSDVLLQAAVDLKGAAGHHVTGDDVTMTAGTSGTGSVGTAADAIQVDARTLTLAAAAGPLPNPGAGLINVLANQTAGAPLSVLAATADDGSITIKTKGNLNVTHVATSKTASTGVVTLTSTAGEISDGGDAFADVVGNKVSLVAQSGIGAGNALELGAQVIGGAGSETQTSTGGIALNNDATGLIPAPPLSPPTEVWLKAGSGDVALKQTGPVALTLHRATTGDGDVRIENVGHSIKLDGDVTATGSDKTAEVTAGKEITRSSGIVEADDVSLTAGQAAGATDDFGIGASGARVQTRTNNLTLTSANAGDIYVDNAVKNSAERVLLTASTIDSATPANAGTGNIVVRTDGSQGLEVTNVRTGPGAVAGKGRVSLQATQGAIVDGAAGSPSISAKELSLEATRVGVAAVPTVSPANPLDTNVLALAARTTGSIDVINTAANLAIGPVVGVDDLTPPTDTGLKTVNSPIDLSQTHGTLTVNTTIDAGTATIFVRSVETATGTLINNGQVTGRSVTLIADNMALATGSKVDADTGILTLKTATPARPIELGTVGEAAGSLNLSDQEFDTLITKNRVEVGMASAGPVTFTAPISLDPVRATTLAILTGATVNQSAPGFTAFQGNQLSISAKTGIGTSTRLLLDVNDFAVITDAGGIRAHNDGDLKLSKVGDVDVVSSGSNATAPNGDIDIISTGTMTVDAAVSAAGSVRLQADNSAATNDVVVNKQIEAGAGPSGHADADLAIEANRHIVVNKNLRAMDNVALTTHLGDVRVHDRVDAQLGNVSIDASSAVSSDTTGDIRAEKAVAITSHARDIDLGRSVTAAKFGITLTAGDAGLGNPNNDIHTGTNGDLSAGGAITLTAQDAIHTEGTILAGSPTGAGATGHVRMTAVAGGILIEKSVTANNLGDIRASAKLDVHNTSPARLMADRDVRLRTSNGTITTDGNVKAVTGLISAHAPLGSVIENGGWSAAGSATAVAGGDVKFNGGVGAGDFILGDAGLNVLSGPSGSLDAGTSVTLTGRSEKVDLQADVTAHGRLGVTDGFITASGMTGVNTGISAKLRARGNVTLGSDLGSVSTHADVTSEELDIKAKAKVDVIVDGKWSARQDIAATADQNVTSTAKGSMTAGRHVDVLAKNSVDLGANVSSGATPPATGTSTNGHIEVTATTGGIVTQKLATLDARAHVLLDAHGDIGTQGAIKAGQQKSASVPSTVTVTSATGNVKTDGTIQAKDEVTITAEGLTGVRNVDVNGATTSDDKSITATAKTGDVSTTGTLTAGKFILLDAKGHVSVANTSTADESITAKAATGDVTTTGALSAGSFILLDAGHSVSVKNTATAHGESITATAATGDVTTSDALKASSFILLDAKQNVAIDHTATADNASITATAEVGNVTSRTLGDLDAHTFVDLTAGRNVTLLGTVKAQTDHVKIAAGTLLPPAGSISTSDTLSAGTFVHMTAPDDVSVLAATKSGTVPSTSLPGDITIDAGKNVLTTGALEARTFIDVTAGQDVKLDAPVTAKGDRVSVLAENGNILTTKAGVTTAETSVTLDAPHGKIDLNAAVTANKRFIQGTASGDITTADTAPIKANTFVHLLSNNGNVVTHGAVTATLKEIKVDAPSTATGTGDIKLDAPWSAGTDVVATAGHDVTSTLVGTITAGNSITLDAKHDVSLRAAATATNAFILATAKNDVTTFDKGVLTAGTYIKLEAVRDVTLAGNAAARHEFIEAKAGNDIKTSTAQLLADDYVDLRAEQNIDLNSSATATRGFLQAHATHGNISTGVQGDLKAGAQVDLQALEGKIDLNASVTAGDLATAPFKYAQALAKNDITTAKTALIVAKDYVLLDSSAGSVVTHGSVTATGGDIIANAAADILADGAWKAGNDITGTAGHDVKSTPLGTLIAGRDIKLTAKTNDITLDGDATANTGHILATAGHDILTTGELKAATDITLDAGRNITSGMNRVTADHDVIYHARNGDIATLTGAILTAGNDVLLDADHGRINLHDDVTGKRDVTATAQNDITTYANAPLTATNRNATLTSKEGSILTQDLVKAGADLVADAKGDITLTGGWQSGGNTTADAGHDINVRSTASYGAAGLFTAGNDVAFTSTGALVKGNGTGDTRVTAGNDIGMAGGSSIDGGAARVTGTAGHDIKLALVKSNFPGTSVDKDQAAVALVAGSNGGPGSITDLHTFSDGSGAVGTASVVATAGGLNATATNAIDLGTEVEWVIAESKGRGDVTLNEVDGLHVVRTKTANGAVDITSGDTMVVRSVLAQGINNPDANATLHAYKNDIHFEDAPVKGFVKAEGHKVTLTAANSISGNVAWENVISTDLGATAGGVITLGTDVDSIVSTSNGTTTLHDFGSVTLADVATAAGDVIVDVDQTLTVNKLRAGSSGGNNAQLTAGASILKGEATPNVWSNRLVAEAKGGEIDLKTRVAAVRSKSKTDTTLVEQDAVTLERVESENGNVTVTSGGSMAVQEVIGGAVTLDAKGDITGDGGTKRDVTANHLDTLATGTISLETEIGSLKSKSEGNATFNEKDDVEIETIVAAGKTVTLNAGGLVKDGTDADFNVTTGTLVVDARGVNLDTNVDLLSIAVTPGAFDGTRTDVAIREKDEVTVDRLTFNAPGNLDLSGGGKTSLNISEVDTRGGNQLYTGALELANTDRNFAFKGHNIVLRATLDSKAAADGYNVTMNSSGQTTFLRPVGTTGKLATLITDAGGATTIKTQVHTAGAMVFNDHTNLGGSGAMLDSGKARSRRKSPAILFNDTVTLGGTGAVLQTAGGGVRFAADVINSSGDTTIHSNTGYVDFLKGINDSATLLLTIDATDGKPVAYGSPTFGDVLLVGDAAVGSLSIHGGNVTVGQVTATKGADAESGKILLAADPRIVPADAIAVPATPIQPDPVKYAASKGLLTLKGNLIAEGGSIVLGDPDASRAKLGEPLLGAPPDALGNLIPAVATIVAYKGELGADVRTIDLVIRTGTFQMGTWDKMTVLGGVDIHATGAAALSDISALKKINVDANEITIRFRDPSALLNDTGVLGSDKLDFGVDFFANEGITFNKQPKLAKARVPGQSVEFGVSSGFADKAAVPGFTFRLRKDKADVGKFLYVFKNPETNVTTTTVLDSTADGPSSTSISGTLTQALPQETPKPTEDTNLSSANQKRLVEMGIYARNASEQEIVDRVSGRVVYLDVPPNGVVPQPSDYTVVAGKLPQALTEALIKDDEQLVDANSPDPKKSEPAKEVQKMLATALAEFSKANKNPKRIDAVAFRTFIAEGDYKAVATVLAQFDELLIRVERMGLTDKQVAYYRERLVNRIIPRGIAVDEMYQVIRASPADRKLSYAPPAAPAPGR